MSRRRRQSIPLIRMAEVEVEEEQSIPTAKEESNNESAILPSPEDLKCSSFVNFVTPSKEKEEIIQGCGVGVDKKRLENLLYRMRKKLKQKADGAAALLPLLVLVMDLPLDR